MKRFHDSGRGPRDRGIGGSEEKPSKLAKNRERIAAANAKRAKPKTKKQYGVSDDPSLFGWEPPRQPKPKEETE